MSWLLSSSGGLLPGQVSTPDFAAVTGPLHRKRSAPPYWCHLTDNTWWTLQERPPCNSYWEFRLQPRWNLYKSCCRPELGKSRDCLGLQCRVLRYGLTSWDPYC